MSLPWALALSFNLVLATVCGFASIRGGRPERIGAATNLVGALASDALRLANPAHLAAADLAILLIDLAVSVSFFWLGVASNRFWPIWAAGFALADLFMTICGALLPRVSLFTYHTGLGVYAYLALGALALGTFRLPADAAPDLRNGFR